MVSSSHSSRFKEFGHEKLKWGRGGSCPLYHLSLLKDKSLVQKLGQKDLCVQ